MADIPVPFNDRRISYTAAGGETTYDTDYPIQAETDLSVARTRTGATTTLTLTTDYTVSIDPSDGIATITFSAGHGAAVAADVYVLSGETVIERVTDLPARPNADTMADLNEEFDRIIMMLQEFSRDESGFVIRVNEAATWVIGTVDGTPTASQFLRRNAANTGWEFATVVAGGSVVSASEGAEGIAELSTTVEAQAGVNDLTIMTPLKVRQAAGGLNAANTFTAAQAITVTAAGDALTLTSTDATNATGPSLNLVRSSATPAASDNLGAIVWTGKDSGGNNVIYGRMICTISDETDASEDGNFFIQTIQAGTLVSIMTARLGLQIGAPTTGDMGAGTLNVDNAIYKDGLQVVGARKTGWTIPTGTASRATFDTATVTTAQLAQRFFALMQDLGITAGGHGLTDA